MTFSSAVSDAARARSAAAPSRRRAGWPRAARAGVSASAVDPHRARVVAARSRQPSSAACSCPRRSLRRRRAAAPRRSRATHRKPHARRRSACRGDRARGAVPSGRLRRRRRVLSHAALRDYATSPPRFATAACRQTRSLRWGARGRRRRDRSRCRRRATAGGHGDGGRIPRGASRQTCVQPRALENGLAERRVVDARCRGDLRQERRRRHSR